MTMLGVWVHDLNPIVVRLGGDFAIRWYGLAYIAGFICAYLILRFLAKRGRLLIPHDAVPDLMLAVMVGTLVGGRLGYVLIYQPGLMVTFEKSFPWWGLLAINQGGMASHGGMIGVVIGALLFARKYKVAGLHALDALALVAPIGIFFGRLANFVNGELLGRIVTAAPGKELPWWAVKYPQELLERHSEVVSGLSVEHRDWLEGFESMYGGASGIVREIQRGNDVVTAQIAPLLNARHPSQLYQAFFEGLLLFVVLWFVWRKPRRMGVIAAWFLMLYGVGRVFTEFYRLPDAHLVTQRMMGLSRGQWLSAGMVVIGAVMLGVVMARKGGERVGGWGSPLPRREGGAEKTGGV